jgi:hydrogenase nickel incorporation protein HypB
MCGVCGCQGGVATIVDLDGADLDGGEHEHIHADGTRHRHRHHADHVHGHAPDPVRGHEPGTVEVSLEAQILGKNDALAARNRAWFAGREILALNLVSAPGAGKTTLLERMVRDLGGSLSVSVIEGDQATTLDGERIRAAGGRVVQLNTGTGCHLEASMIAEAIAELRPASGSVVMIENVGNLVCPALFDLGEWAKVAILSVTEGEDKPLKYPHMFRAAKLMLLNKVDLLPHLRFDPAQAVSNAQTVNADIEVIPVSAATGEGLEAFYDLIRAWATAVRGDAFAGWSISDKTIVL